MFEVSFQSLLQSQEMKWDTKVLQPLVIFRNGASFLEKRVQWYFVGRQTCSTNSQGRWAGGRAVYRQILFFGGNFVVVSRVRLRFRWTEDRLVLFFPQFCFQPSLSLFFLLISPSNVTVVGIAICAVCSEIGTIRNVAG